jgi:hypothetical protein
MPKASVKEVEVISNARRMRQTSQSAARERRILRTATRTPTDMERPSARAALVGMIVKGAAVEAEVRKDAFARAGREEIRVDGGIVVRALEISSLIQKRPFEVGVVEVENKRREVVSKVADRRISAR